MMLTSPASRISYPKAAVLSAAFLTAFGFLYSATSLSHTADVSPNLPSHHREPKQTIPLGFQRLFDGIRLPPGSPSYTDAYGQVFKIAEDGPYWTKPLKKEILIVDIDTRVSNGANELWNRGRMNWETLKNEGDGGMISASQMNHFLYAQIHGYDYRFFQANDMDGLHNTWVKPHVLYELLHGYKFVVFIDADATVQHLEVPLEWMFNRWGIGPETSIAMPVDVRQMMGGNEHIGEDDHGKMEQNTGMIVAQSLPHTFEMLKAWKDCPDETRYEGCGRWKEEWAHEQRAFSLYIRYEFNPNGTNIIDIPCDDAMGFPGLGDRSWIADNCTGQFVRHHTIAKDQTKRSTEIALLQSITDLAHKELMRNKEGYLIRETSANQEQSDEDDLDEIDFE